MHTNLQAPARQFHDLMRALLRAMQIPAPPDAAPEVYSFTFDSKTEVHIFSHDLTSIDVLAKLGVLQNRKAHSTLLELLAMNRYARHRPPLNIGMDPASGITTLWTRTALAHSTVDGLTALLTTVLDAAAKVQQQLQGGASGASGPARAARGLQHNPVFKAGSHHSIKSL